MFVSRLPPWNSSKEHTYLEQVEKLLAEVAAVEAAGTSDLGTRSRLLERVAGEVSRLSFQV